jgi:hypothetical protein
VVQSIDAEYTREWGQFDQGQLLPEWHCKCSALTNLAVTMFAQFQLQIRPERDHILRGETTVEILSTMIAAIKCQFTISTEDLLLRFSNEICKFDPLNSVKAFSVISNSTSLVQPQEFYVPKDSSHEHYRFTLMFNKGHYYKLKKFSRYVTDIQVWVLILLFIFGFLWSFYAGT